MIADLIGGVASAAAGATRSTSQGSQSQLGGDTQNGGTFTIAPQGINLGAIMQPFMVDPAAGGAGMNYDMSGLSGWTPFSQASPVRVNAPALSVEYGGADKTPWFVGAAIIAATAAYLYMR
jgi:hypothetical protein